ncbi:MAG: redoxin family protein [Sphingopyxis sp.]
MSKPRTSWLAWAPLAFVAVLGLLFVWGLVRPDSRLIASHWIDQPMPAFDLSPASPDRPGLNSRNLADGRPRIVNVFASWCIPCRVEAPVLEQLRARGVIIEGIAIRDRPQDLARYLAENGNPYSSIGADERSSVQIALGSSGVPESFLVDGRGIIREQIQGVIAADQIPALVAKLEAMHR